MTAAVQQPGAAQAVLEALRAEGVQQFDPVRFRYLEVLASRADAHGGGVRQVLDAKLQAAAAALRQRHDRDRADAPDAPHAAQPAARDCSGPTSLGDLVRLMAEHAPTRPGIAEHGAGAAPVLPVRSELKSVAYFRNTWSRLSAEKQVAQALEQAPRNAGPINSHVVALRALALMRDTSPDYLNRFLSYVDTLISLDPAERPAQPVAKTPRATKPRPKR